MSNERIVGILNNINMLIDKLNKYKKKKKSKLEDKSSFQEKPKIKEHKVEKVSVDTKEESSAKSPDDIKEQEQVIQVSHSQEHKEKELDTLPNNTKDDIQEDLDTDDMWGGNIKLYNRQNLKVIKNALEQLINSNTSINLERKVPIYNPKNQFGGGINPPKLEKICLYENKIYGKLNNGSIIKINKKNF